MSEEIRPVMVAAIEDFMRSGKQITPDAIADEILTYIKIASRLKTRGISAPAEQPAKEILSGESAAHQFAQLAKSSGLGVISKSPGESRIVLPTEAPAPQALTEFWTAQRLLEHCKVALPPKYSFQAVGGETVTIVRFLRQINGEPDGSAITVSGVEVKYCLPGSEAGPTVVIWTTQETVSPDAVMGQIDTIAMELYRKRGPVQVQQPVVRPFTMDPDNVIGFDEERTTFPDR